MFEKSTEITRDNEKSQAGSIFLNKLSKDIRLCVYDVFKSDMKYEDRFRPPSKTARWNHSKYGNPPDYVLASKFWDDRYNVDGVPDMVYLVFLARACKTIYFELESILERKLEHHTVILQDIWEVTPFLVQCIAEKSSLKKIRAHLSCEDYERFQGTRVDVKFLREICIYIDYNTFFHPNKSRERRCPLPDCRRQKKINLSDRQEVVGKAVGNLLYNKSGWLRMLVIHDDMKKEFNDGFDLLELFVSNGVGYGIDEREGEVRGRMYLEILKVRERERRGHQYCGCISLGL